MQRYLCKDSFALQVEPSSVPGSHVIYVPQPAAVAELIQTAVNATIPATAGVSR